VSRKPFVIAAVSIAMLGLSACATSPGTAATVGEHRITTEQVQADSTEVLAAAGRVGETPLDPAEVNRRQVNRLVTAELVDVAAEREGVTVTDAEIDALLLQAVGATDRATFADQLALNQLVPPSALEDFARTVALNQKLLEKTAPGAAEQAQAVAVVDVLGKLSTELGTDVSPRFGTWSPSDVSVGLPPNDISSPAPAATQLASGTVGSD
jgi:hypothetical protein